MLKKKYMMVVALTIVSILLGSLLYSNLAFGASGSSGSWGAIRFEELTEVEVPAYPDNVTVAQFDWYPQNSSNNALLFMRTYWQYCKKIVDSVQIYLGIKLYDDGGNVWMREYMWGPYECYQEWKWIASSWVDGMTSPYAIDHGDYDVGFPLNQARYRFVVEAYASNHTAYVRNLNIIITVADGMVPNEYYKVELPSEGVGGLYIPVDKFSLLSPYLALASTIILAVSMSVAYIKYRKKQ